MKRSLLFLFTLILFRGYGQDENLLHSIQKQHSPQTSTTAMFTGGIEISEVPSIDTNTNDSTGTSLYTAFYLNYQHKSNLGVEIKTFFLPGSSNPGFYLTSVSPYYANYNGNAFPFISFTRFIDHRNPAIPYSPIQNEIYARMRIKTKIVDPVLAFDAGFGKDEQNDNEPVSDFNSFVGISRTIIPQRLNKEDEVFAIVPTVLLNAATDRYFKFSPTAKYISQNRSPQHMGYGRRNSNGGTTGATQQQYLLSEDNGFAISNLEANIYLMYFLNHFSIEPSASLFLPLRGENRNVYGYWQINLNYWIR